MKAIALDAADAPPQPRDDLDAPTPGDGELLVRVQASSVNPVDNAIAAGMLAGMMEHEYPVVLGRDFAGVVEQAGAGVSRFAAGDEVLGVVPMARPTVRDGSWAELIVVPDDDLIAARPAGVDVAAAGAAPLAAITAIALVDALDLSEGDTVLVVGATGGVGGFAVQLAAQAGATVLAPAFAEDEEHLRALGVDECLDRDTDVAVAVRERHPEGVDGIVDLVSYGPGAYDTALKAGGRVASPNGAAGEGPGRTNVMATEIPENLQRLPRLLESGALRVHIQDTYELERAGEALQALASEHTVGKRAVRVA